MTRAITHPAIAALQAAGYAVTFQDEPSGELLLTIRQAGEWLQSKSKEGQ